jgi:hypothetical protein
MFNKKGETSVDAKLTDCGCCGCILLMLGKSIHVYAVMRAEVTPQGV